LLARQWSVVVNLTDSCLVAEFPASVNALASGIGMTEPISLAEFIGKKPCSHTECVVLHLKTIYEPNGDTGEMIINMRQVYDTAGIGVAIGSREELRGNAFITLLDVDVVTDCPNPSAEQNQLFTNVGGVGTNEIVIYFVRSTVPSYNGCASHPAAQPGAIVAAIASPWTLAHETGHVLGLSHISGEKDAAGKCVTPDTTRLMTGCSTSNITATPTLSASEGTTMTASNLTMVCPT
jgi:hypothetical protein